MNRNVLITGASGNLGKAAVDCFLENGYNVIATVSPKGLGYEAKGSISTHAADLTNEQSTSDVIAKIITVHKTIDVAILTVGGYAPGTIDSTDGVSLRKMMSLNFDTAYFIARPVFRKMLERNFGRIIFIGSKPGLNAVEGKDAFGYALSKSLIFRLSEVLNAEAKGKNVVASVIVPSTIDTPDNRNAMPTADFSKWVKVEDIAKSMLFLASDEANALRQPLLKMYGNS